MIVKSAPSITRVHTLHRIRTVVNHVTKLVEDGVPLIDDFAVADHLIKTHLSKATKKRIRDQICRRARDHLETARYLGLIYRIRKGSKFTHIPTDWGRELGRYKIAQECPSDPLEEAIFVDRICRFKLSNASYRQETGGPYSGFRSRLCLTILSSLEQSGGLNVFQIASILANPLLDVNASTVKLRKIVKRVKSHTYEANYLKRLDSEDKRNIKRDTLPFIDWCKQLGLLEEPEDSDTIKITSRGKAILDFYAKSFPIWWADLGYWSDLAAAAIILINYLKEKNEESDIRKLTKISGRSGLFTGKVGAVLHEVTSCSVKQIFNPGFWFDFSLSYDVPPERWELVEQTLKELLVVLGMKKTSVASIVRAVEWSSIRELHKRFKREAAEASQAVSSKLQIKATVPTASIQYHFQSDYEAATYVFLQHLQRKDFLVSKYQGQLVEYFSDQPQWRKLAGSNPDLLVTDGFLSLVECKSVKEWGPKLVLNKAVISELIMYGNFVSTLKEKTEATIKCRAVFSYEGEIEQKDWGDIEKFLSQSCASVAIVLRSGLQKALVDKKTKSILRGLMSSAAGYEELKNHIVG